MCQEIRSDRFLEYKPHHLAILKYRIEKHGKYHIEKDVKISLGSIKTLLEKSVKIVENTEEYTEYLLLSTFGEKDSYKKTPPGTIRIFSPLLYSFFNGRCWRKIK